MPATPTIDLGAAWALYAKQAQFAFNPALFSLFLAGVGAGKTHALTAWVIARALRNPNATGALLGRTSVDLATVLLPNLFDRLDEIRNSSGINLIRNYDKGQGKLSLINGAEILFRPFNRIAKLRGTTFTFIGLDEAEFSEAPPDEIWAVTTGRLRGKGPCPGLAAATSPNGLRGITRKFVDAQGHYADAVAKGDKDAAKAWACWHVTCATSHDNPYLPPHFFDALNSLSKRRYQQEVEGKVLRPLHSVLPLEDRHLVPWRWQDWPSLPRVYGVDWGTQGAHVAVMAQVQPNGTWTVADELIVDDAPRGKFQDQLHRWIDGHGRAPPALIGVDRAAPVENGILERHYRSTPVRWMESREEQRVTEGLEMVRDLLDPVDGDPKLRFATSLAQVNGGQTAPILPALRGYVYHLDVDGVPTTRPRKDNINDHAVDALRYAVRGSADVPHLHGGRTLYSAAPSPNNNTARPMDVGNYRQGQSDNVGWR